VTIADYRKARHIVVSRSGAEAGAVDRPFLPQDLVREAATIVGGFSAALALARASDLVATVPERHTASLREGLVSFALPFRTQPFTVSLLWHPRLDADPAHRWLRSLMREVCGIEDRGAAFVP
jgi:DNA-binding transcriptional LysR family regulator